MQFSLALHNFISHMFVPMSLYYLAESPPCKCLGIKKSDKMNIVRLKRENFEYQHS